jgi:4-alpha-glucanotransferase
VSRAGVGGDAGGIPGRASGILLHPTSLAGPWGVGDLGAGAVRFLDWLAAAGQRLWQVLPLGPTGYGDSPYACFSSFAGNPLLVALEPLREWGVLGDGDLTAPPTFPAERVDYGAVLAWKLPLLRKAARRFLSPVPAALRPRFDAFREAEGWWLDDYCFFTAIKTRYTGAWNAEWPEALALRDEAALGRARDELAAEIAAEGAIQFFFRKQWDDLRAEAHRRGIRIIGDLAIFAAPDSADVWAHRANFLLDARGRPTVVSGVPPDYFAATGQLWGNPLYDWDALARSGFRFWVDRIRAAFQLFDFVRIDHFRGFDSCWTVPADSPTAETGHWEPVPGQALFEALERELGELAIIAEDLGLITPAVNALRERFGFPGMRVLQFAFDSGEAGTLDPGNRFLPHNHVPDSVVYTGTHDNDTTRGWFQKRTPAERSFLERYAGTTEPEIQWRLIRLAMSSVARFSVVPLQDVLGLGSDARMNTPGTTGPHNWSWRVPAGAPGPQTAERLRALAEMYGRT